VAEAETPLTLEQIIPLDGVSGRIDHMAIDAAGKRLFVAELGNGSIDVIDLQAGKAIKRISNLREPQGVAYIPDQDLIVVAGGGDGSVRFYHAADLKAVRTIPLGDDADNIRIDPDDGTVLVGYGKGGLAIFDRGCVKTLVGLES
jgi:DNA-binding beta-propeller fold protein YncE